METGNTELNTKSTAVDSNPVDKKTSDEPNDVSSPPLEKHHHLKIRSALDASVFKDHDKDKGKQKQVIVVDDSREETTSVAADEEEYELEDDEVDKVADKHDKSHTSATTEAEKLSKRGRWSTERKQILLEGYATLRPFTARYGQVKERWQELADLVNSHEKATLGTLRARSCKDMIDKLIDTYRPMFSEESLLNTSKPPVFSCKLEEAAYQVLTMSPLWVKPKEEQSNSEDNVFPTSSVQSYGLKRSIDDVSAEEDNDEPERSPSEEAFAQRQENVTPENPLHYLQYLEYLPAIANALNTIAANCSKK